MNIRDHIIIQQFGKGMAAIRLTDVSRTEAFAMANEMAKATNHIHHGGNVPTYYVCEVVGSAKSVPKKRKEPKRDDSN